MSDAKVCPVAPINSPEFFLDMPPTYHWLRDNDPVHHAEGLGYFIMRTADVEAALAAPECFSASDLPMLNPLHPIVRESMSTLFVDDPDHARLRGVVNHYFMPRNVNTFEPRIQEIIDRAVDGLKDFNPGEIVDLQKTFAYRVPIDVLSIFVGLPKEDFDKFHDWAPKLNAALMPEQTEEQKEAGARVFQDVRAYLDDVIATRDVRPDGHDTVLSLLKDAVADGRMRPDELSMQAIQLYLGGHETTLSLIGLAIQTLLQHPSELEKLKADPSIAMDVINEVVRYDGVSQVIVRRCAKETTIAGTTIPKDAMVFVSNGSANHDPAYIDDPDSFIVDREKRVQHYGFGKGIRFCLGNHLARLEARLAINALFKAYPDIRLPDDYEPQYIGNLMLNGLKSLPVILN